MINFSKISNSTFLGKTLRNILKIIPKNSVLPILQGSAKGMKWIVGSGVYGYWLGSYEMEKQKVFSKSISEGDVVFDIGAHVGFYTLIASKLVGETGKVYSFEPFPKNISYLKKHIRLNKLDNVKIVDRAVSNKTGEVFFEAGQNSSTGKISKNGQKIQSIKLDDFIKENIPVPDIIKMDIEGGETETLKGAEITLRKYRPVILLATHGKEIHKECLKLLERLNYQLESIGEKNISETSELIAKSI